MSVVDSIVERVVFAEDHGYSDFVDIGEEVLDNPDQYTDSDPYPRLKHGTSLRNVKSILHNGLQPGDETASATGETGYRPDVSTTTLFPAALMYAQHSEVDPDKIYERAQELVPHSFILDDEYDVRSAEDRSTMISQIEEAESPGNGIGEQLVDFLQRAEAVEEVDSERTGPLVVESPIGAADNIYPASSTVDIFRKAMQENPAYKDKRLRLNIGDTPRLSPNEVTNLGILQRLTTNELAADNLQELQSNGVNVNEQSKLYVPHSKVDEINDMKSELNTEAEVLSLEARALAHEAKMADQYQREGKIVYKHPWSDEHAQEHAALMVFDTEEGVTYDSSPASIDISNGSYDPIFVPG